MTSKYTVHIISNTHWDREWLYNFQATRMMLVDFFDGLLDIMETHPEYSSYVLDSQSVPIEDYLEVRPENRERIKALVRSKRLLIGPWYTCPEGFEVTGESLVRNLLMGHRIAAAYGHIMKVGHTPFSYGQNSQMPQIYAGFGIDTILFYHGVSHDEVSNEWIFEGADGTRILGSQMSSGARYNYYHGVYRPAVIGKTAAQREYEWSEGGMPFHRASLQHSLSHHVLLCPKRKIDRERLQEAVRALREAEVKVATTRHLTFMMGHDSSVADVLEPEMIALTREYLPEDDVIHGNYESLMEAIKTEVDMNSLSVLHGERRVPKPMPIILHLYSDVLSSRTRMKYRSAQAEYLIQARVEPFTAVAALLGSPYPARLLEVAWKTMLRCHAHDSISGSGVDAIEEDMMNRLRQVLDIGEGLYSRALAAIQQCIDFSSLPEDALVLTVYNPTMRKHSEVVSAVVDLPWEGPRPRGQFTLRDAATGELVAVQCAARSPHWSVVNHAWDAPSMMRSERFIIHFNAENIPGLGYASYVVDCTGVFAGGSLITETNTLENDYLRAKIQSDGTITLLDKQTGTIYSDLHYFVDDGEGGHAWMHVSPAFDRAIDSRGFPVSIALEEDGPLLAAYRVEYRMHIPSGLDENGGDAWQRLDGVGNSASRGSDEKDLIITSRITLRKNGKSLEINTQFTNMAECHRLRVMFPTRRAGICCHAESAFDVVERETEFGPDSVWHGAKGVTFPMQRFVDVNDTNGGIAFISEGLREYEVTAAPDRCIAITLLRAYQVNLTTVSFRWEAHPEMKLSQSPGLHDFTYRIFPHTGDHVKGNVLSEAERHVAPLEVIQSGAGKSGVEPLRNGLFELNSEVLQVAALKRSECGEGWIVRIWNPSCETQAGSLAVPRSLSKAMLVSLEEKPEKDMAISENCIYLEILPKRIITLLLAP